ncbi:FadR family transcriptional regulator [Microbacterium oleivorans]|uniref:FadR/GntR family transcriptional regulator n=1 Tax=Microbacterium oleivorans TaxID=273677 RepID=UPI0010A4DCB8|nr:FadR/GntR family transcriptional regulator [Microbacterium oleivorans]THE06296.1 FadR family transcriptional regulator [Microbacterium oleivorans]
MIPSGPSSDPTASSPRPSQTDIVVASILSIVESGKLRPGDRLPIEKDLAEQIGVSRGSLREGVRALAVLGVVETRQGDGTYITALDAAKLLGPLTWFADRQMDAEPAQLLNVRRVLEAESAALAARVATEEQIAEMSAALDRVDVLLDAGAEQSDIGAIIDVDTQFHRLIAQSSGNPLLAALVNSLAGHTYRTRVWRALEERGATAATQAEHRGILDEIARHDSDRARMRMHVHLLAVEDFAESRGRERAAEDQSS